MSKKKIVNALLALSVSLFSCAVPQNTSILSNPENIVNVKSGNVILNIETLALKEQSFKVSSVNFNDTSIKKLKLEIVGSGITTPVSQTVSWVPGQSVTFNLSVASGTNRILTLSALDGSDNVMGSLMGSLDVTANQSNVGKVSFFETSVAQILFNILNSSKPSLLNSINNSALRNFVKTVTSFDENTNKFGSINPSKLDTKTIADLIVQNNGAIPATSTPNLEAVGSLALKLNVLGAKVLISDPNSSVVNSTTSYDTTINNITPGRWVISVIKEGYSPSKMIIDVVKAGVSKTVTLATGSARGGNGNLSGKDETGDLGTSGSEPSGTGSKTLIAIYLLGSDLEDDVEAPKGTADEVTKGGISTLGAGSDDLREIALAYSNMTPEQKANIDIIVGFGGANKQGWKGIKYTNGDCIVKDSGDNYFGNDTCYSKRDDLLSMGKGSTLADFVTYVKDNYPASNYNKRMMDLWDHGGSHKGYGPDTNPATGKGESMTLKEINDALAKDPVKYDIVGFDACLMGSLDVARFVQRRAKYLVASEELEPGHGWEYTDILNYVKNNPSSSAVDLGRFMVDSFTATAQHKVNGQLAATDGKTLSIVNLSQLDNVYNSLNSLSNFLGTDLGTNKKYQNIMQSAQKSEIYGKNAKSGVGVSLDIKDFLGELRKTGINSTEMTNLENSLNQYIIYSRNDGTRPKASGVAIFDINNKDDVSEAFEGSPFYKFERGATQPWISFVKNFVTFGTQGDSGKPSVEATTSSTSGMTTQGLKTLASDPCADGSCYKISDDKGIKEVKAVKVMQEEGSQSRFKVLGADPATVVGTDVYKAPQWNGNVLMIDNNIVPVEYSDDTGSGDKLYIVDGLLNDEDVVFTFQINSSNQIVKNWATPFDNIGGAGIRLSKEQLKLKSGDKVQFFYNIIDTEADNDDEFDLSNEVTIGNAQFSFAKASGSLYTFLAAEDLTGNFQNTDLKAITSN